MRQEKSQDMLRDTRCLYNRDIDETEASMRISVSSDPSRDSFGREGRHIPKIILNLSDKLLASRREIVSSINLLINSLQLILWNFFIFSFSSRETLIQTMLDMWSH